MGVAVVCRFAGHVGEVHALAEHVASNRGLRRSDTQALAKDTTIVRRARPVPQKPSVGILDICIWRLEPAVVFALTLNSEYISNLEESAMDHCSTDFCGCLSLPYS
jgi:hypothetical protein